MRRRHQSDPTARPHSPPAIVVMGVTGSGKTVVGGALAEAIGALYVEGDQLHPPENIARMASGLPLTDAHREGWLDTIGERIAAAGAQGRGVVAACSALKRIYRDRLRRASPGLVFVYLAVDPATARLRVGSRKGHFMPASLVESQFAILEPPEADERALVLDASRPLGDLVDDAAHYVRGVAAA